MQREYRPVTRDAMQLATSMRNINIQNQRITESNRLEKTYDHGVHPTTKYHISTRQHTSATSSLFLNTFQDSDSTTSMGTISMSNHPLHEKFSPNVQPKAAL